MNRMFRIVSTGYPKLVHNQKLNKFLNNSYRTKSEWTTDYIKKSRPGVEGYDLPPLTEKLKEKVKTKQPSHLSSRNYDTHVTTLDNGLKVASEKLFGEFCTVGVIIDAGARYESPFINGITHFIEKLAFSPSSGFKNRDQTMSLLEKHGGICDCQSTRDAIVYALSCRRTGLPEILNLLSNSIYNPLFDDSDMEQARRSIEFELEDLNNRTDPEILLAEMIHKAAYQNETLGNPKLCPIENINTIKKSDIYSFMNTLYKPNRTVLACVGVDHGEFVNMTKEHFLNNSPIWLQDTSKFKIDNKKPVWHGGSCIIEKDLSDLNQGSNNELPELTHIVIGLESPSFTEEKDFVTSCVINTLMGGGGSFSAGGPGKGMYSRLYLNVLNKHHFMFSATACNQSYADSGIFSIHASSPPQNVEEMCHVIGQELLNMAGSCNSEELNRAKKQLQSMLFMNLEQRPVLFEDVARQVLSRGKREQAQYYFDRIQAINESDIKRVAKRMLNSPPAVASLGRLGNRVQPYELIKKILSNQSSTSTRSFFRPF